jgi:hypothetical protein
VRILPKEALEAQNPKSFYFSPVKKAALPLLAQSRLVHGSGGAGFNWRRNGGNQMPVTAVVAKRTTADTALVERITTEFAGRNALAVERRAGDLPKWNLTRGSDARRAVLVRAGIFRGELVVMIFPYRSDREIGDQPGGAGEIHATDPEYAREALLRCLHSACAGLGWRTA